MAARSVKVSKRQAHAVCVCVGKGAVLHLLLLHVGNVLVYLLWGRLTDMTGMVCAARSGHQRGCVCMLLGLCSVLVCCSCRASKLHWRMLQDTRRCRCGLLQGA